MLLASIGVSSVAAAAVLIAIGPPELDDSLRNLGLGLQAIGLVVVVGALAFSVRWRATVTVSGVDARRLLAGSVFAAAVAESGFLVLVLGYIMRPELVLAAGAVVGYIATLLTLLAAAGSAQVERE